MPAEDAEAEAHTRSGPSPMKRRMAHLPVPALALSLAATLAVAPASASPAKAELDVAYGKDHPAQTLDLYLPKDSSGFATVMFVHGGSLTSGDKRDADHEKVCAVFVASGLACASINYRLLQDAAWPAAAEDTAAAFAWMARNIAARGGDPGHIFLVGHSSGARLVVTIATDEQFVRRFDQSIRAIRGVVAMGSMMRDHEFEEAAAKAPPGRLEALFKTDPEYRAYGTPERYRDSWPLHHIHAGIPPVLFIIAEREKVQPPVLASAEEFVKAAGKVGARASYKIVPGRHIEEIRDLGATGDVVLPSILEFIHVSLQR